MVSFPIATFAEKSASMNRRKLHLVLTGSCWAAAVLLTALQLSGWIDWPWMWVLAPLWLPLGPQRRFVRRLGIG
jgi:hypothetical protein